MQIDAGGYATTVHEAGEMAVRAEADGFDGSWVVETQIDPLLGCTVAAERTGRIGIGTAIAVAFARNPMTVAVAANDVQALSGGRFVLGMGSQIKPHITRRFSMPWSRPAARMREFVLAVRAIWDCFENDTRLQFDGEFYTHTLMTPFFNPGPNPHGRPKIYLAGVGERMTEVAGEVADGFFVHSFTTERYVREVTLPALLRGRQKVGKDLSGFEISAPLFVAGADSEDAADGWRAAFTQQVAFYGSTPAYRPVLELQGMAGVADELNALSKRGRWDAMGEVVTDDVLDAFTIIDTPDAAARRVGERYGDVMSRLTVPADSGLSPELLRATLG